MKPINRRKFLGAGVASTIVATSGKVIGGNRGTKPTKVSVMDFITGGSGTVDDPWYSPSDTAGLREADELLGASGIIEVPAGYFEMVRSYVVRNKNGFTIHGDGNFIIPAGRPVSTVPFFWVNSCHRFRIEGLTLMDNEPTLHIALEESHGVVLKDCTESVVAGCQIINVGDEGINVVRGYLNQVLFNRVEGAITISPKAAGGITLTHTQACTVTHNRIIGTNSGTGAFESQAIRLEGNDEREVIGVDISHNMISDAGQGVNLNCPNGGLIRGLRINNNIFRNISGPEINEVVYNGGRLEDYIAENNISIPLPT